MQVNKKKKKKHFHTRMRGTLCTPLNSNKYNENYLPAGNEVSEERVANKKYFQSLFQTMLYLNI